MNGNRSASIAFLILLALGASVGLWSALGRLREMGSKELGAARPKPEEWSSTDAGTSLAAVEKEVERSEPELAGAPQLAWDGSLRIHFRVRAEDGSWDDDEDGRAGVVWDQDHARGRWTVDIKRGVGLLPAKEAGQPARKQLEFVMVRLNGARARVLAQPVPYPTGPDLTVDCELLRGTDLVVFDGPGQMHASHLQLVLAAGPNEWNLAVPIYWSPRGPTQTLGRELVSPIALAAQDDTAIYFVRSKRSAWSRIAIDHETPGTRYVHLDPGGRVEFAVRANTLRPETALRIYAVGPGALVATEPSALATLAPSGNAYLDGLRVGRWEVRAELGTARYGNPSLGSQQFEVTPGDVTQVTLDLQDPPAARDRVWVRGVIVSSEPIERERFRSEPQFLELSAADPWSPDYGNPRRIPLLEMQVDPADPKKLSWDAGKLTPGPCSARLKTLQYSALWTIEPERDNEFTIQLADLRTLVVQVVERASRAPVPLDELRILRLGESEQFGDALTFTLDDPPGRAVLQGVEGRYRFELVARGIEWGLGQRMTLEIPSLSANDGNLEIEFSSAIPCTLSVQLRSGDVNVPLPGSWWEQIEFASSSGVQLRPFRSQWGPESSPDPVRADYFFTDGGPLEIRFPATDEFRPIPSATVQLVPGATSTLALELEPVL